MRRVEQLTPNQSNISKNINGAVLTWNASKVGHLKREAILASIHILF